MNGLTEKIESLKQEIEAFAIQNAKEMEAYRIQFLGTKGIVKSLMAEMKNVPLEEKQAMGQLLNDFKIFTEEKYEKAQAQLDQSAEEG
ncbi:MAG: phenylalanine--tRNA ligase subunit alpha, partial [Bacteroidota bacterium]